MPLAPPQSKASAPVFPAWVRNELKTVETTIKFAGYLAQQQRSMPRLRDDEARAIPTWFDYRACSGLSREMVEKLDRVRPLDPRPGQPHLRRNPSRLSLIQVFLEIQARTTPTPAPPHRRRGMTRCVYTDLLAAYIAELMPSPDAWPQSSV